MSWSVSAFGKAPAVRKAIAEQFKNGAKCAEPEETVRQAAAQILDASLAGQLPGQVVEVSAHGGQSTNGIVVTNNTVSVAVTPRLGFLE